MKLIKLGALVCIAILAIVSCAPQAGATTQAPEAKNDGVNEIVIGAIYPMTGSSAQIGQDAKAAIELAVEIVNGKHDIALPLAKEEGLPNLGGAKVKVVFGDHQGQPDKGQAEAERLITQEKAVALIGSYHSSVTQVASEVAERYQIPFLCPESSSATLHTRGLKYFFRTTPHDGTFSEAMFEYIDFLNETKNANISKVALFHEDTLFGTSSATAQTEIAAKHNYEIVQDVKYTQNATSLNAELLSLKAAKPDVILTTSYPSDAILFVNTAIEIGYTPPLVIAQNAGYVEPNFITAVGKSAEGLMSRAVWSEELMSSKPIVGQINELYKAKAGKDIADNSAREFTGMIVLLDAINRAGSTDPAAIQKALMETDMKGDQIIMPWPGIKFDPNTGQNELSTAMMIQLQDGKYRIVWPAESATAELIYPNPDWGN
ncbi:MAG TPA: ABC transporter substrate-binding protein [Bellilinea sp.]|nr:ABC transporter substrate-binding protein [Bellilinea sp.]